MEITKVQAAEWLEISVRGRLDSYWSDHLTASIEESVRQGAHHLRLNLSDVEFLSSAGIRVLLKSHKHLRSVDGSLTVTQPSEVVRSILAMAGLSDLFMATPPPASPSVTEAAAERTFETAETMFRVYDLAPGATLACRLVGDPGKLPDAAFDAADCHALAFDKAGFGVGLGAIGSDFADCRERFGEFLAVASCAVYLPADGTGVPDFMVAEGSLVPEIKALFALCGEGPFARLARFEPRAESSRAVTLATLAEAALEIAAADAAGVVLVAESAGLVGAALMRSPARAAAGSSVLGFPAVRDWLSFSAERVFDRTLCVVVGIAARQPVPALAAALRPLGSATGCTGHFHAAAFPYRPLPHGVVSLEETVSRLFRSESIQGVLHLLEDDRPFDGIGQSEFVSGACWVGPIGEVRAG